MNSFIVVSKDTQKRKEFVEKFCKEHSIDRFDQFIVATEDSSIGIAHIRDIQKTLFVKPLKGKEKMVILDDAQKLTPDAQNALLKILEEPPVYSTIILSSVSENAFLPTILSRCKLILLASDTNILSDDEKQRYNDVIAVLETGSIGEKLVLAEKLANKKELLREELEKIMIFLRARMLQKPKESREVVKILENFQRAYKLLQITNVSPRMILEHAFLELT